MKKILVVEDDKPSAAILSYKLKANGYAVVSAPDGAAAVELVRTEHPDLMILDLGLPSKNPFAGPNWDGFGVMDWLHRSRPEDPLPIIVVSAWDRLKAEKRSLDAGALAFFSKPVHFDELLATIRKVLDKSSEPPPPEAPIDPAI